MSMETTSMPWAKNARLGEFFILLVQTDSQLLYFQSQQVSCCRKVCAFFMLLCCLHFELIEQDRLPSSGTNVFLRFQLSMKQGVPMIHRDPSWSCASHSSLKTLSKWITCLFSCSTTACELWHDWFYRLKVPKTEQTLTWQVHVPCLFGWKELRLREIPLKSFNNSCGRGILWVTSFCSSLRYTFVPDRWQH